MRTPRAVKDFLRRIAAKGGSAKSKKKLEQLAAARAKRWPKRGGRS